MKLRKLASNAAYLTMDWISITVLSSLFWIISGKLLSSAELGGVSTALNFASILHFFSSLGIGIALSKLISEFAGGSNETKISTIVSSAIKLLLTSNLLLAVIILIFSSTLSPILKLSTEIILIALALAVFLSISNVLGYILIGFQNMKRLLITNFIYHLAKISISVILVLAGFSFLGPLAGITLGLLVLIITRLDTVKLFSFRTKGDYKDVLKYSIPAFFGGIAALAFTNVPYITLTAIKDLSITGIFTPAMLLVTPLFIFPATFTVAMFPIISNLSSKVKKNNEQAFLINIVFRYATFLTLPIAVFLILFSSQIISLLFKPEYLPAAELLRILSIGALLQGFSGIFLNTIYALRKPKVQQNIIISSAILFIILSLPFTYYLSALGMTIAYVISTLTLFLLSFFYVRKLVKISLPYSDILKISTSALLIAGFIISAKPLLSNGYSLILILPSIVIYFFVLLFLNFYNQLDLRLIGFLSNRSPSYFKSTLNFISRILQSRLKNSS